VNVVALGNSGWDSGWKRKDSRASRWRVPLERLATDAELDVKRAAERLSRGTTYNVALSPVAFGVIAALAGLIIALGAALRAHYRDANGTLSSVHSAPASSAATQIESNAEVEVDLERDSKP
jgi:hypothetical protein